MQQSTYFIFYRITVYFVLYTYSCNHLPQRTEGVRSHPHVLFSNPSHKKFAGRMMKIIYLWMYTLMRYERKLFFFFYTNWCLLPFVWPLNQAISLPLCWHLQDKIVSKCYYCTGCLKLLLQVTWLNQRHFIKRKRKLPLLNLFQSPK